ncbi:MAG: hypothetical protein LUG91_00135 [Ruminococcus sp.]|nr:hypothetical protein [Ruminococcus sp.]
MPKIKFCPSCGNHLGSKAEQVCSRCKLKIIPVETKYDYMYYIELAKERYPESLPSMGGLSILNEEIAEYVKEHDGIYRPLRKKLYNETPPEPYKEEPIVQPQKNVPKCPVCQSTNIVKISGMKRALHGYALGLFSKTARSQFECKSCGYKF